MTLTEFLAKTPSRHRGILAVLATSPNRQGSGARPSIARPHHQRRLAATLLGLTALLALAAAPAASAEATHPFLSSFDGSATPAGSFGEAGSVAVDGASGDVYVADLANHVIDKFTSSGAYLCQVTGAGSATTSASECDSSAPGTPTGSLAFEKSHQVVDEAKPASLAVDNSSGPGAGDLYATIHGVSEVQRFEQPTSGEYTLTFEAQTTAPISFSAGPEAIETALGKLSTIGAGNVFVGRIGPEILIAFAGSGSGALSYRDVPQMTAAGGSPAVVVSTKTQGVKAAVDRFGPEGAYLGQLPVAANRYLAGVAVDGAGNIWVLLQGPTVQELAPSGSSLLSTFTPELTGVSAGIAADSNNDFWTEGFQGALSAFDSSGNRFATTQQCQGCLVSIAADLATDELYVFERKSTPGGSPNAHLSEYGPAYEPELHQLSQFGQPQLAADQEENNGNGGGIAVNPITGEIYVADAHDAKVYVFAANPGPRVAPAPPSEIKATEITANGIVNPEGAQLSECHFEYGTETTYGKSVPCAQSLAAIGSGNAPVPVSAVLTGLKPGATYHFRLAAASPNGANTSADRHAATLPAPLIDEARAIEVGPTSATLTAKINPKGNSTHYRFEYDTAPYAEGEGPHGTATPVPDEAIGAGTADVEVSQPIAGLSPGTTYHWRVVATNVNGEIRSVDHSFVFLPPPSHEACPGNEAFRTGPSAILPDCRAYEQVSPTHKNGALLGDDFTFGFPPRVGTGGTRVVAWALQCFAAAQSCNANNQSGIGSPFAFNRTASGWQPTPLSPPAPQVGSVVPLSSNADTGTALFAVTALGGYNEWIVRQADGSFLDLGPESPPAAGAEGRSTLGIARTSDYSHFLWEVQHAPIWPFDQTSGSQANSVYEYVGAGHSGEGADVPFLLGVSGGPGSTSLISTCGTSLADVGQASGSSTNPPLSADGRTVYFLARKCATGSGANAGVPVPATELYARIDGEEATAQTLQISARSPSDCSGACLSSAPADAEFAGAAPPDGSQAFFFSTQQLTDAASQDPKGSDTARLCDKTTGAGGCNLYLYDFNRPAGENLIDLSAGDTSGGGPRVQGMVALSPDGSHAYFVAKGVLAGANVAGQSPVAGADNLYVSAPDPGNPGQRRIAFIAALPGSDDPGWTEGRFTENPIGANVTPDGRFLLFASHGALTADDTSASPATQVFRYDAQTETLLRLSIGERGFNDNGNRSATTPCSAFGSGGGHCSEDAHVVPRAASDHSNPSISDNGAFAYFTSPVALTPGALDDVQIATAEGGQPIYAQNVYQWEAPGTEVDGRVVCAEAGGCIRLIYGGHDTTANHGQAATCGGVFNSSSVCLLGTDASGRDVFFSTADPLLPSDTDTQMDYYDARIGGGFAAPPPTQICETADACHSATTAEGASPAPATPGFNGPPEGPNHPQKPLHHKKKHHKKKHHKRAGRNRGGKR